MSGTQQLIYGLIVTLIGMGIVFIVLIALSYMLDILKIVSNRDKTDKGDKEPKDLEEILEPIIEEQQEDQEELIAVIGAAVAVMMGSQSNIIVRSIRRVSDDTPIWAKLGKQEQIYSRL